MGNVATASGGNPEANVKDWKKEIRSLMKDFNIPRTVREIIINQTIKQSAPEDTEMQMYNRAWRKMYSQCMASM